MIFNFKSKNKRELKNIDSMNAGRMICLRQCVAVFIDIFHIILCFFNLIALWSIIRFFKSIQNTVKKINLMLFFHNYSFIYLFFKNIRKTNFNLLLKQFPI